MHIPDIIKAYFQGLQAGSYEQVIRLFDQDALIHSPLYGKIKAQQFYKELFADTSSSKITLKDIFVSIHNQLTAAAHFVYEWTLKDGTLAPFECIDVFKFSEEKKIVELKIIYDTYRIRGIFQAATTQKK